jgi:hypothetical protein
MAQGDFVAAEDFCHRLDRAAQQYASQIWIATARQSRAELAEARHDLDEAENGYLSAHHAFMTAGYDYEAARCMKALASVYAYRNAAGDEQKAQEAGHQAQQTLRRLGLN